MSSIDNIINKLKEESEETILNIKSEAQRKSEEIKSGLIEDANREKDRILEQAKNRADTTYTRISENAEIRIRDQRLVERQKLIDRVFKLALDKMNSKSDEEFVSDVKKVLENIEEENLTLQAPKSRIESLKKSNLGVKLDEENFVENGFILMSDSMNYNYKYEDILMDNRDTIGPELIKFLSQ